MERAFLPLVQTSLRRPKQAAELIMAMDLGRDVLWTALALVAVINTFLVMLLVRVSDPGMPLPSYFERPLALFIIIAGLMAVYIHAMYWAGLAIGGKGRLMDVLALVVWFQVLRALAQMAIVILSLAVPPLGLLLSLAVAIWGFWIFLNFIAAALELRTPWHAMAVLAVAFVGLVLGLGVLMALIGGIAQGALS
jgi:hypothetical protein